MSGARLTYVVGSLHPGGTERLVVEMSRALRGEYELQVICLDEPGQWADDLRADGIPVHCTWRQPGLDLLQPVRLAALFRLHRTQIIHAHQTTPWFYSALARLFYRAPRLLLEEHGRFHPEADRPLRRWLNRLLIVPLTHRFVAVSEDIRRRLDRYEGVAVRRTEVIYNGVAAEPSLTPEQRHSQRHALGLTDADFVVGTVGRFDPIKNLPMLVESLALARQENPAVKGLLVGDGPEHARIKALLASTGLAPHVHLPGFRQDARRLVQCLDLFTLTSFSEGTSMALLEAQAARVPVAVTAVGGNPEIVKDCHTGWLVASGDAPALARRILEAAAQPQRSRQLAAAALESFAARFSLDSMLAAYRRLYAEMLS